MRGQGLTAWQTPPEFEEIHHSVLSFAWSTNFPRIPCPVPSPGCHPERAQQEKGPRGLTAQCAKCPLSARCQVSDYITNLMGEWRSSRQRGSCLVTWRMNMSTRCSLCKLSISLSGFCLLLAPHLPEVPGFSDSKAFGGLHNKKGNVPH